ncbi:MAG: flagellar biosynthesis anti-sigma factor FlgM [Pseudomonadota bacterium]
MKIGHLDKLPAVTSVTQERKPAAGESQPGAGAARTEASAQVELSSAAALLGTDAAVAEFDSEKVERIAQAIRDGKFTVNAEAIADKLIANAQELLGRGAH